MAAPDSPSSKVALVVSNSKYKDSGLDLPGAARDHWTWEGHLGQHGFSLVECLLNRSRQDVFEALEAFETKISNGSLAVFVYSGHGLEWQGQPYIMCTSWSGRTRESDIEAHGVGLGYVMKKMARSMAGIILLDACRQHVQPAASSGSVSRSSTMDELSHGVGQLLKVRGSSGQQPLPFNGVIGLACLSNGAAIEAQDQGVYTTHLLEHLLKPGKPVMPALSDTAGAVRTATQGRQVPQTQFSTIPEFLYKWSLVPANAVDAASAAVHKGDRPVGVQPLEGDGDAQLRPQNAADAAGPAMHEGDRPTGVQPLESGGDAQWPNTVEGARAAVSAAVQRLDSSDADDQRAAARWIATANPDAQAAIAAAGAIPGLVRLLSPSSSSSSSSGSSSSSSSRDAGRLAVQLEAAQALQALASGHPGNATGIVEAGGVTALAVMLCTKPLSTGLFSTRRKQQERQHQALQQATVVALATVLALAIGDCEQTIQQVASAAGAVAALVQLMDSSKPGHVQQAAAGILRNLAAHDGKAVAQQVTSAPGAVAGLVRLLESSDTAVQEAAAGALRSLAACGGKAVAQQVTSAPDTVAGLMRLLDSSDAGVQEAAAGILCILAASDDRAIGKQIASAPEAVAILVRQLRSSSSLGVQEATTGALRILAGSNDRAVKKQIASTPQVVNDLVQLLGSSSQSIQQAAAGALGNLAANNRAVRQQIASVPNAVCGLVQLLGSSRQDVQQAAAGALGSLAGAASLAGAGDQAIKQQITSAHGAVAGLVQLLYSSSQGVQLAAAGALNNLLPAAVVDLSVHKRISLVLYTAAGINSVVGGFGGAVGGF